MFLLMLKLDFVAVHKLFYDMGFEPKTKTKRISMPRCVLDLSIVIISLSQILSKQINNKCFSTDLNIESVSYKSRSTINFDISCLCYLIKSSKTIFASFLPLLNLPLSLNIDMHVTRSKTIFRSLL